MLNITHLLHSIVSKSGEPLNSPMGVVLFLLPVSIFIWGFIFKTVSFSSKTVSYLFRPFMELGFVTKFFVELRLSCLFFLLVVLSME